MSSYEQEAKPLLLELLSGRREILHLDVSECEAVARWATKTVFVLNSASNYHKTIPQNHYLELRVGDQPLPDRVYVFAQQHHGKRKFAWFQGAMWKVLNETDISGDEFERLAETSYKVTLQIGKLILLVAHWPHDGWRVAVWHGIHLPLWPRRGPVAIYESDRPFPWNDSADAVAHFHATFMLMHDPSVGSGTKASIRNRHATKLGEGRVRGNK